MPEDVRLTLGTKEHVILSVKDRLNNLTTLDGANTLFDLRKRGASGYKVQNAAATNIGMTAYCLIDTSGWTDADIGTYDLYLHFTALPEVPRIGPYELRVDK